MKITPLYLTYVYLVLLILLVQDCSTNHFVSSGNLNFKTGPSITGLSYTQNGSNFNAQDNCITSANDPIEYELTLRLEFNCDPNAPGKIKLKPSLFVDNTLQDNLNQIVYSPKIGPASSQKRPIGSNNFSDLMTLVTDYDISANNICRTEIYFHISISPNIFTYNNTMHLLIEITEQSQFNVYGTNYNPNCESNCDNNFPSTSLDRYLCYEDTPCKTNEDIIIFELYPICPSQ